VAVQSTEVPGDKAWPTQPIATLPEPFVRQAFIESDISDRTPEIHTELLEQFKKLKTGEQFIPFGFQGAFIMPGFDGGGEWGGAAVDPESQIMYVNASEIPWWSNMQANPALNPINGSTLKEVGKSATRRYCVTCHGAELQGNGKTFPSLADLNKRMTEPQLRSLLENGRSLMPAFKQIPENEKTSMIAYLLDQEDKEAIAPAVVPGGRGGAGGGRQGGPVASRDKIAPYTFGGYHKFYDKDGYPGVKPPWGSLNAINLSTGKRVWKIALGEFEALKKQGLPATGTEVYGGPVVTKGGLVFVASTQDEKIRAFDKTDGKMLWEAKLPAAGYATPAVYTIKGRQFVVIAAGGGKLGSPVGSQYVAFALPEKR
ncbi:MAG TPA: c-type cytochrome, partial [Cyclobacteriaceae bacterium]|nr:c-type cytochrome [Cyclobacteriaceae bacterium]